MGNSVKIDGIESVANEIRDIADDKIKRKEILKLLRRQSKPLLAAIKDNTPVSDRVGKFRGITYNPEHLKKSMGIKTGRSKTFPNVLVGPRKNRKNKKDASMQFAFWIQYGTVRFKPHDFIWKAAKPKMEAVHNEMSKETKKYIEKKIKQSKL